MRFVKISATLVALLFPSVGRLRESSSSLSPWLFQEKMAHRYRSLFHRPEIQATKVSHKAYWPTRHLNPLSQEKVSLGPSVSPIVEKPLLDKGWEWAPPVVPPKTDDRVVRQRPMPLQLTILTLDEINQRLAFLEESPVEKEESSPLTNPISYLTANVEKVITREMANQEGDMANQKESMAIQKGPSGPSKNREILQAQRAVIAPFLVDLTTPGPPRALHGHQLVPSHAPDEVLMADHVDGTFSFDYSLQAQGGTFHGTIIHRDVVPTQFEVDLPLVAEDYPVPVFTREGLNSHASHPGGFLLVELDDEARAVDLDIQQEEALRIIHLGADFKTLESGGHYMLFTGVPTGNAILRILNRKGEISEKVVFVSHDEMTYCSTALKGPSQTTVSLYQEHLFGKESPLDLPEDSLGYFNLPITPTKEAPHTYSYVSPPRADGMRQYLEVEFLGDVFVVGHQEGGELFLPSEETVGAYLERLGLDGIDGSCVIQINTQAQVKDIQAYGLASSGPMLFDLHIMGGHRALLAAHAPGIVAFRVFYQNGKEDFLKSYCSLGTYLIEHL